MYKRILVALDGSICSNIALKTALALAERGNQTHLIGCHVYAARMHRTRFEEMEPGLPESYQEEERLNYLRHAHDDIIGTGMKLISDAYLAPLIQKAEEKGLTYEGVTPEGRNYVELLRVIQEHNADLVVMGAWGHGHVPEGLIGSLTERILFLAPNSDILVMKKSLNFEKYPIVVGIDGSENSYAAMKKAVSIARAFGSNVEAVAVYDPFFHTGVFQTITEALPDEARQRFNFAAQERLHDEIIDQGLENLYREGLERSVLMAQSMGIEVHPNVLAGKVYSQLYHYATLRGAGLIVMGRWGLHREKDSIIGSNTLNITRLSTTNVLVVTPPTEPLEVPKLSQEAQNVALPWTPEAELMMERVPIFAREMARRVIEDQARERDLSEVTPDIVQEIAQRLGMKKGRHDKEVADAPEAQMVSFRKIKRLAPDFHRHILRSKLIGQTVRTGERILVYEVLETDPPGLVRVTEKTRLEFR